MLCYAVLIYAAMRCFAENRIIFALLIILIFSLKLYSMTNFVFPLPHPLPPRSLLTGTGHYQRECAGALHRHQAIGRQGPVRQQPRSAHRGVRLVTAYSLSFSFLFFSFLLATYDYFSPGCAVAMMRALEAEHGPVRYITVSLQSSSSSFPLP
jgi:hypothetical protein